MAAWWRKSGADWLAWIRRPSGLAVAQVARKTVDGLPLLRSCRFFPQPLDEKALADWLRQRGVRAAPAVGVLDRDAYLLLPADEPTLPRAEWSLNLRWKIADRLSYPAEQAVVETFAMPELAKAESRKIYLAVAREARLQQEIALFHRLGLSLQRLDIIDLALGRLADALPQAEEGMALLYWSGEGLVVGVRKKHIFYLARQLEGHYLPLWPSLADSSAHPAVVPPSLFWDELALELRRTFHYYENNFAQEALRMLWLVPFDPLCQRLEGEGLPARGGQGLAAVKVTGSGGRAGQEEGDLSASLVGDALCAALATRLGISVQWLSWQSLLHGLVDVEEEALSACLPAIGALLGQEGG
ncbi:MAG: hypothetical protein HQM06_13535 [Magnetococcales bacterium]|nr:hypothetical protein [Magnetococcales bacterium]